MFKVVKNLARIKKSPRLLNQARMLDTKIHQQYPDIGKIYNQLLNQSSSMPIACNFISQVLDKWAEPQQRVAIKSIHLDKNEQAEITYAELVNRSHQLASFFIHQAGLKPGNSVALMLGQRPEWWYSLAGLMRGGIAVVPCPRLLTSKDLVYRINDLGIDGLITTPELEHPINAISAQCPSLKIKITTGLSNNGWISLTDVFKTPSNCAIDIDVTTTTDDPCVYLYTSGTTGQPKAVQHNSDYPFFHWPTGRRWMHATPNDIIYNASDTGWGFTVWTTTAAWTMGSTLLITPTNKKFNPEQMLVILRDQKVTIFCAAPTVLRLLVAHPQFNQFEFPTLKRVVTVGEALDETVIQQFEVRGIQVAVGFGQAETPLLIGRVDEQLHVANTMGQAISPYKVVALDDNFKPLPPGNAGQIAVDLQEGARSGIMRGYANAPEKTKKTRSPDERYHLTGDWAKYRPDGFFAYHGRKDDLIKSRGYRIGPDEVEKAGMSHPAIAKIAVVGIHTNSTSHAITIKAFVLLKPGIVETPKLIEDIQEHIKKETGPYKYPRLVECLDPLEWEKFETTSGKIRRVGLREREEKKLQSAPINNNDTAKPSFKI